MSRHQSQNTRLTLSTSPASHSPDVEGRSANSDGSMWGPCTLSMPAEPVQLFASHCQWDRALTLARSELVHHHTGVHKTSSAELRQHSSAVLLDTPLETISPALQIHLCGNNISARALATLMTRTHSYLVRKCCTRPVPRRKRLILEEFASTCNTIWTDFPNISFWNSQRPMASDQLFAAKFKAVSLREVATLKPFCLS